MTYKILSTQQAGETLITLVEYNFDGTIITTEIAHFMPQSTEEIEQNIINRASSEIARIEASTTVTTLIGSIIIGEEKSL
jgi:hypothetical protein